MSSLPNETNSDFSSCLIIAYLHLRGAVLWFVYILDSEVMQLYIEMLLSFLVIMEGILQLLVRTEDWELGLWGFVH